MNNYDVVVIGAGVIGTSVAYHIQKKGYSVCLVENGDVASGTSSHCDAVALICDKDPGIDTKQGYASLLRFKELREELSYDFDFVQRGCLYVCESEPEMEAAKQYVEAQVADGYDMWMLDRKEIFEKEPYLARDLIGGFWSDPDAGVNPYKLCFAFVNELKKLGAAVMPHTEVLDIRLKDGRVDAVITDQGEIGCEKVVNCAGVWAPFIGRMVGIDIPIQPRKGCIMISERGNPVVHQKVQEFGYMMSKFDSISYTRNVDPIIEENNVAMVIEPTPADNFMLGSNRALKGYNIASEIDVMKAEAMRGIRFFPILKEINCIRTYAGMRPFVVDHLPIVSEVEEIPGFYIAAGHEGDGISLSAITGKMMSQIIAGEETDFNIDQLKFSRFRKKA
ncbi:MAG: FAD-binding oxidoreductase [Firmicutes bacterium]|nr:FAD-binding oxidoreductase [Bacillota bacterium]